MSAETEAFDRKSLRKITGRSADWGDLAATCVCFANASGGEILVGIEDGESEPPPGQQVEPALVEKIRRRVGELTVNVHVLPSLQLAANGGGYIAIKVGRSVGVASTSDGRYFLRVADDCKPVLGDDVMRLAADRPAVSWETRTDLRLPIAAADAAKQAAWVERLRRSARVKPGVKEKSPPELLVHYELARDGVLTNLGVLLLARAEDRARLGTAPIVQAIRYDEQGTKIGKHVWDDHVLSAVELVDAIWAEVPDFRDSYELPMGLLRTTVPAFDEAVVRELVVNALVHRPYTQGGDLYLNLHPDRLEVVNPGRLPFGVTPRNILHASRRRNDALARVFHDLELMEREGSGFDLMYERLLSSGRSGPTVSEIGDSVRVVVPRRVVHPAVIRLLEEVDARHQLTQRERITLGMLAQSEGLRASELADRLELAGAAELHSWLGRLQELGIVAHAGRTTATRYFVRPEFLRAAGLDHRTTLARLEPHRLRALVLEDLRRYPGSGRADIHRRIAPEIHPKAVSRTLEELKTEGLVSSSGVTRWTRYRLRSGI
jgi:ATP-dependent DNA helicase RecG